jgi:tRNA pseudouridine55 synthase
MYELARDGITVDLPARRVMIRDIEMVEYRANGILFDVTCSKGTYIRSLCVDIGRKLNLPAVMSFLVRTRVGSFSLSEAKTLEELEEDKERAVIPPDTALKHMNAVVLSDEKAEAFQHGQMIPCDVSYQGLLRIYHEKYGFIGIARQLIDSYQLKPIKVLPLIE